MRQALLDARANTLAHQVLALQEEVQTLTVTVQEKRSQITRLEYELKQQHLRHEASVQELQQTQLTVNEHVRVFRQIGGQLDRLYHEKAREQIGDIATGIHNQTLNKGGTQPTSQIRATLSGFLRRFAFRLAQQYLTKKKNILR